MELSVTVDMKQRLDALFTSGCDPYAVGAAVLFAKSPDAITQDERDIVKRVFMHIYVQRREREQAEQMSCTGTLVHDEFTVCPVHDRSPR
jgi:hypothetical protein